MKKIKTTTTREHEIEVGVPEILSALRSAGYPIPDGTTIRAEDPRYGSGVQRVSSLRLCWSDREES